MSLPRISLKDIRYLAFEGGGGAGNIYPGAVRALANPAVGLLKYDPQRSKSLPGPETTIFRPPSGVDWRLRPPIQGISGASAGAINALFLSSGYTPVEIDHIMASRKFETFFDVITPGLVPRVGGFREEPVPPERFASLEEAQRTMFGRLLRLLPLQGGMPLIDLANLSSDVLGRLTVELVLALAGLMYPMPDTVGKELRKAAAETGTLRSLHFDLGIFPGFLIRRFLAQFLALAVERVVAGSTRYLTRRPYAAYVPVGSNATAGELEIYDEDLGVFVRTSEISFRLHQEIFGVSLLVTGTNLETEKSHFFSAATTPRFGVVDAVRISMSLPGIFKPLVLQTDADLKKVVGKGEPLRDHFLRGVWVDGGYFNNIPVDAFDELPDPADPTGPAAGVGHTLGLVVGLEGRTQINTMADLLKIWPVMMGLLGTGSSQVSATTTTIDRVIQLDTFDAPSGTSIGLLDFTVDPSLYVRLNAGSELTVLKWFREAAGNR